MSRLRKVIAAFLLIGVGGVAGYLFARGPAATEVAAPVARAPLPVEVVVVAPPTTGAVVTASGAARYRRELPLGFKVAGVVRAVTVDIGDRVAAGAVLATLDPTEVSARLADARAMQANAQQDFERTRTLVQRGYLAPAALDRARMELDRARAAVTASAFDATRASVRAPVAGVVLARHVEPGEVVAAGNTAVLLGDLASGFVVDVPVADTVVGSVRPGDAATFAVAGAPPVDARVTRVAAMADPATGTFDVELALDAAAAPLRSGMVGRARITASAQPPHTGTGGAQALAVPALAILEGRGDRAAVFRIDARGRAERVGVRIAGIDGDVVRVDDGLAPGDRVVTAGAAYLRHGEPVAVVRAGASG